MKNQKNNKKGISLIVLVITIIVIIILAAAVILSINNNNPIENANRAKNINNEKTYEEELALYELSQYKEENGYKFNSEIFNVFDRNKINEVITSMLEEDKENYIIWQGKLAKRDGEVYKYINGEEVKFLDGETVLTEKAVEFASELSKTDILYNGGCITNCYGKVQELKDKLLNCFGSDAEIRIVKSGATEEMTGTWSVGTSNQVWYKGELVAKTVVFGDINGSDGINSNDGSILNAVIKGTKTLAEIFMIAADVDHNGIIDKSDVDFITKFDKKELVINQSVYATMSKI